MVVQRLSKYSHTTYLAHFFNITCSNQISQYENLFIVHRKTMDRLVKKERKSEKIKLDAEKKIRKGKKNKRVSVYGHGKRDIY